MAGYSGTPLVRKLGIKPDTLVRIVGSLADLDPESLLGPLPPGARVTVRAGRSAPDLVIIPAETDRTLRTRLARAKDTIAKDGTIWVWWPKKASDRWKAGPREVTEDTVRALALELGLVDVKVCAVDETWSGLKLVYRLANR